MPNSSVSLENARIAKVEVMKHLRDRTGWNRVEIGGSFPDYVIRVYVFPGAGAALDLPARVAGIRVMTAPIPEDEENGGLVCGC